MANLNSGSSQSNPEEYRKTIRDLDLTEFLQLIQKVNQCYKGIKFMLSVEISNLFLNLENFEKDVDQEYLCHENLKAEIQYQNNNIVANKHLRQQVNLKHSFSPFVNTFFLSEGLYNRTH